MAAPRRKRTREVQLGFEALSIEGALLSAEWLSRIAQLMAGAQSESDYRIKKGLNLRDEIGRYWRIAQAHWSEFTAGREARADGAALAVRFVESLLRDSFDFTSLERTAPILIAERSYPIGLSSLNGRVPVVVAPAATGLDVLASHFGDGTRRRSAFGLAQEYLNAQEDALWGIACDGLTLRIVRDNASLTRPAWIEADLQRIFKEEGYADFAALWLLMHETRFGRTDQPVTECALEVWRNAGLQDGTAARDRLRDGVKDALLALGQGFLAHPDNQAIRADLRGGCLSTRKYFNQLLRLVYRLIFLLTVEERGLLHGQDASAERRALYASGYSLRRLRDRSVKRSAHDRFSDLWDGVKIVLKGVAAAEPRLGLPALAGIFAGSQCPHLDAAKLENRGLLLAVFKLAWLREDDSLVRVNWRDMGPEELGSVYESLLELVPQVSSDGRQFTFLTGGDTKGNARKTTGSYYTPDSLVQVLLDSALEPVIDDTIARNPDRPIEALLGLSIVDSACGSGHFLLAAARRLASHIARIRASGTPSAADYRHALRQVVGRCIYGVDLNPMAVELCKVSLWMEAVEPGLPLTFLNSHIQHGNALLGTTPELMAQGIPDAAWEPIEGDDKKIASLLRKRNKAEAGGQRTLRLTADPTADESRTIGAAMLDLEAAPDVDVAALANKETKWEDILESAAYRHQKFIADAWCAAFVWPKQSGELADSAPTNELWRQMRDGAEQTPAIATRTVNELADQHQFFHWQLQFPQVFTKGGFDVVLGNPPWERVKLSEQEFFASRSEEIDAAPNAVARKRRIAALLQADPQLWKEWCIASRIADGESHLARQSGRYPSCGKGDVNTYALFAEHNRRILGKKARAGFIVPTGLVTDETTSAFFDDLMVTRSLVSVFDFENRKPIFPSVDSRFKFALITLRSRLWSSAADGAEFVFFARDVHDLTDPSRRFVLTSDDVKLVNPETRTCPIFRSRRDADLTRALYGKSNILGSSDGSNWGVEYLLKMVDPTIHRDMLVDREARQALRERDLVPLYEGKSVHHFDHRYALFDEGSESRAVTESEKRQADFYIEPRYWILDADFRVRMQGRPTHYRGFLSVRDITNVTNERTVVTTIRPFVPALNSLGNLFCRTAKEAMFLCGCLNSYAADYIARQKVGGTHLSPFYLLQLAVIGPDCARSRAPWQHDCTADQWVNERVLELTYCAWDLEPFAHDIGYSGPPFRWDPKRRFLLRCELDAAFFHLFGLSRDDADYVMNTFPIVRKNDEKAHDEYRTKRVILEIYDEMADAAHASKSYHTRLDPPPADPRVAHPRRTAVVVPFPAQTLPPRQLPAWGDAIIAEAASLAEVRLDAGAWATNLKGEDLGMAALAAVLRNVPRSCVRDDVERAVVLTVLPQLMQSNLTAECGKQWRAVIGSNNLAVDSVSGHGIPWKTVLRKAIQQGVLLEDESGRWGAGPDIADAPDPVFDARALVVLSWLATAPAESTEVSTQVVALRAA